MTYGHSHTIEAWGEFACFTSPLKVERWSYPVPTPSAARGIFDAIYVNRHEFRWQIESIEILSPPRYIALMRNEVKEKGPSENEILAALAGGGTIRTILADADSQASGDPGKGRTQRQTMALRDVRYRITAAVNPLPQFRDKRHVYGDIFARRLKRGQQFTQPCFGCREFAAWWGEPSCAPRWPGDLDAGWMLYDVFDLGLERQGEPTDMATVSLFRARVKQGLLKVPSWDSPDVKKVGRL